jgi:choline dehydrogenase-like flavoprotein
VSAADGERRTAVRAQARAEGRLRQGDGLSGETALRCDVVVVGSGAGGAVLAAGLAEAGLDVVVLEEGGDHGAEDFDLREGTAYPMLYQDRGARATSDLALTVLQGRGVGGSTTVNWTTCFRTPERVLAHWRRVHGLTALTAEALAPHFAAVERRLSIAAWPEAMANANNRKLLDGARALGWQAGPTRRNVAGCANTGYCGVGCPVDGKQAMHLTYLIDLLAAGGRLLADCRAERVQRDAAGRARGVEAAVLDRASGRPTGATVRVEAKVVALCGGAINTPALLLRSGLTEGPVGARTFLHPVVGMAGLFAEPVRGFQGAPQSIASHAFIDRGEKMGFFLEAAPVHPMLIAFAAGQFGATLGELMGQLAHLSVLIALAVDGLDPSEPGGTVRLDRHGRVQLDYPIGARHREAFAAMHGALGQVLLAAGAASATSLHREPIVLRGEADLPKLAAAAYGAHEHGIFTAHQMGGAAMGPDPAHSVVRPDHRHHRVEGLYVVDGSVLPTALGVNPSQTVYGLAHRARAFVQAAARGGGS